METAEKFYSLLFGQAAISESDARWAAELCAKYPYCHAAHLLRARGVSASQTPSANRSQLLFQIAAQVPSAVSVYRATHGSLLPLTIESDDLLYSDRESEAWQTQETSAVSGTPFSTESTQYQRHEPLSDGGSYSTSTVAYSNPQETVATQESASSTPREEAELKLDTQALDTPNAQDQAHDPSFAAFYSQAGSGVQEQAESAANDGKNGVVEPGLANADTPPAAARGTGGGDSSMADSAEPTTVVMDWNALLGGSTRGKGGRPKEVDTQTHGLGTEESAPVGAAGAEMGEVDLRGVLDQSLATPVPEMSASLFTLEGGAGTLSAEGYEYVRTQLNPLYRKAKQEGKDQMQRIESYLNNLDSLLETMREMAKKPADFAEQQEDLARESSVLSRSIVSEHLADMHAEKGDFAIAITMYNRLAARNPEKSAYFAGKIEALRER